MSTVAAVLGLDESPLVPAYGAHIVRLLRSGWQGRHAGICPVAVKHDWRLGWPVGSEGWLAGGGTALACQEAR